MANYPDVTERLLFCYATKIQSHMHDDLHAQFIVFFVLCVLGYAVLCCPSALHAAYCLC
jgi:hypothetical protein